MIGKLSVMLIHSSRAQWFILPYVFLFDLYDCFFFVVAGRCDHGSACDQLCYELHDGMYECACTYGYQLNSNGYSCQGEYI